MTNPEPNITGSEVWKQGNSSFKDRARYYMIGVAIGLILLGFFWASKNQAARRQALEKAQEAQTTADTTPKTQGPAASEPSQGSPETP